MKLSKNKNLFLFISVLILLILYILSFSVNNSSKDKRKPIKTALVNSKYESTICEFKFQKGENSLFLKKTDDLWYVSEVENSQFYLPADNKKVNLFLKDLIKVINLYKISDNLTENNNFGFDSDQCFTVIYDNVNELKFGSYDFTKTSRYLMTGKNLKVYEINLDLDKYLSTSIQNWYDPYIVFRSLLDKKSEDIQTVYIKTDGITKKLTHSTPEFVEKISKLLELRHGGACKFLNNGEKEAMSVVLEYGDSSSVTIKVYPTDNESNFNVEELYSIGFTNKKYVFTFKISLWTYNKIKETML